MDVEDLHCPDSQARNFTDETNPRNRTPESLTAMSTNGQHQPSERRNVEETSPNRVNLYEANEELRYRPMRDIQHECDVDCHVLPADDIQLLKTPKDKNMTRQQVVNMTNATIVVGVSMAGYMIYDDSNSQWLYAQFEKQVIGANYSSLNISIYKDPCLHVNGSHALVDKLNEAQSLASNFQTWATIIALVPALLTNLVLGAYSDCIGRKILFYAPLIGFFLSMACTCIVAFLNLNLYWLYVGYFLNGICGTPVTLFMALFIYMADNTGKKKDRSFSMVVAQIVCNLFMALSHIAVGYFIDAAGYLWPMVAGLAITSMAIPWTTFFLKESAESTSTFQLSNLFQGIKAVFSFYLVKGTNPKHKRKDFIFMGIIFFLFGASMRAGFRTMYLMNEPLCWSSPKIGIVTTAQGLLQSLVSLVGMRLLQYVMSDELICIVGLLSGASNLLVLAFADVDWMVYIACAVDMLEILVLPVIRSVVSQMVPLEKRGSLFSSIAVIEVVTFSLSGAGSNALYSATVSLWRGLAYFVIGCCVIVAAVINVAYIIILRRRPFIDWTYSVDVDGPLAPGVSTSVNDDPDCENDKEPLLA